MSARRAAHVVHCPFSNLKLASGFCPVAKLLKAGVNVCIGTGTPGPARRGRRGRVPRVRLMQRWALGYRRTDCRGSSDSVASNNELSMLSEVKVSASLAKAVANDARAVPVDVAIQMATINGARAYGWDKETGSLLPGKSADFIALSLAGIENYPVFNAVTHLIYSVDRSQYDPAARVPLAAAAVLLTWGGGSAPGPRGGGTQRGALG